MPVAAPRALLRRLEWRVRDTADSALGGEYRSAFRGRGREFDQVVKYAWGDDIRDIDWNVTARLGEPYRKRFVEERELTLVLLFEDSTSLQFGSGGRSRRDALLELAGLFALLAAGNRDRAGSWHATPDGETVRRPVRGRVRVLQLAAGLLERPAPELALARPVEIDWKLLYHAFPRHSVIVWLGDFPPRAAPPGWTALRRRYQVIGARVDDPWDVALPDGAQLAALDPGASEILMLDTGDRDTRARHREWREAREAAWRALFPAPSDGLVASTEDDPVDTLVRFFRARMRLLRR